MTDAIRRLHQLTVLDYAPLGVLRRLFVYQLSSGEGAGTANLLFSIQSE
jgi:hypothetical protein